MASSRSGVVYPPGSAEIAWSRNGDNSTSQVPRSSTRKSGQLGQPGQPGQPGKTRTRTASSSSSASRPTAGSRIPQAKPTAPSSTSRKLSQPSNTSHPRPPLTHQSQSWGSIVASSSSQARSGLSGLTSNASTSSSSSRSRNTSTATSASASSRTAGINDASSTTLRRKLSAASQNATASSSHYNSSKLYSISRGASPVASTSRLQTPLGITFGLSESPAEHRQVKKAEPTGAQTVTIYPELDRYQNIHTAPSDLAYDTSQPDALFRLSTQNLPPATTPQFSGASSLVSGVSASPSTRFSESPAQGPYSRDTTPTSFASQSPGYMSSVRSPSAARSRRSSRGRAGSIGNDTAKEQNANTHPLSAIRESVNSSSSSSNGTAQNIDSKKMKKKRPPPLPPTPPPRKSSQRFKKVEDESEIPTRPTHPTPPSDGIMAVASASTSSSALRAKTHGVVTSPQSTPRPPSRPSRDGTPDLQSQLGIPLPIIQSNLTSTTLADRRVSLRSASVPPSDPGHQQPSTSHRTHQQRVPIKTDQDSSHRYPPKNRTVPALSSSAASAPLAVPSSTAVPREEPHRARSTEPGRVTRTPSPSLANFRNRFPMFGRRHKAATTSEHVSDADKKEKVSRKGPAAGTGHEGYGRLGTNRRRSTSTGNLTRGTQSSQESLNSSQPQDDPFLRDRLSPVVISGGEVTANRNTSSVSSRAEVQAESASASNDISGSVGLGLRRPSAGSRNDSQVSLSSREGRNTLWPSALPRNARQASPRSSRLSRPSDSSDSEAGMMRSTLAFRRSVQRQLSPDSSQLHLPKPIVVQKPQAEMNPSVTSLDASIMSDDSALEVRPEFSRRRKGSNSSSNAPVARKLTKRARSPRKWNFFGRTQSQPASAKKATQPTSTVAVTVDTKFTAQETKPIAFYTILDSSEAEDGDMMDVEEVLREAHVLPPQSPGRKHRPVSTSQSGLSEDVSSHLQTVPPSTPPPSSSKQHIFYQISPPSNLPRRPQQTQKQAKPVNAGVDHRPQQQDLASGNNNEPSQPPARNPLRPSRLPQVGRIPKVISARSEKTSPMSFSRPFNRASMQMPASLADSTDIPSVAKGPSPPKSATPELVHDGSTLTSSSADHITSPYRLSRDLTSDSGRIDAGTLFLAFPPRNNSQSTSCTTSSSSGILSFAVSTAVVPDPSAPLVEDEIWDEYNDLLGEEAVKVPQSATSSHGMPFHLETPAKPSTIKNKAVVDDKKTICTVPEPPMESPTVALHPPGLSLDEAVQVERPLVPSSVYSSDMMAQALESADPSTPFSVSEFVSGYGDRNSMSSSGKTPAASQRSSASSHRSGRQKIRFSDGSVYSQVSEDNSPTSQVNLRVGSMTVSKWLTFGHVLFSPARDDLVPVVSPPNGHSVLVLDGLGNDDWSFYAAETYPAATFFNLSPRPPLSVDRQSGGSAFPLCPPNHHQIQFKSYADKLPFQSEIFTTVVYRFPAAAPESHYKNIIGEARRVLKPGGYLELSVLDFDLNNMGNRTRRAIRRLKEQIHSQAPDIHLGSTADLILRLLGTKGYTDVKSCRVGVPVASNIPRSSREASDGDSSKNLAVNKPKRDDRSLAEMISDDSPVADESITNMVARVGRWWHSRCYGEASLSSTSAGEASDGAMSNNMWTERALLAECEAWRTNLKLMVCYARVPDVRRVASL